MSDITDSLKHITQESHPDTFKILNAPTTKKGLPRRSKEVIDACNEANTLARQFQAEYKKATGKARAPDIEGISDEFLGSSTSREKGIYKNNTGDVQKEIERMLGHVANAKATVGEMSEGAAKESLLAKLNEAQKELEKANDSRSNLVTLLTPLFAALDRENSAILEEEGSVTFGDIYDSVVDALDGGDFTSVMMRAKNREDKKKAQLDAEVSRITSIIDPNENYLNLSFREQCFIQKNIYNLIKLRQGSSFPKKAKLPYFNDAGNSSVMCGGNPYGFVNRLTQPSSLLDFFDIPHDVLSNLQPEVRLYKVVMDADGKDLDEIEITFPGGTDAEKLKEVFKNKKRRGYGVGMKSFEWAMEGSDPFAAKRMISAKLAIHATNFTELLRDRSPNGKVFKYADLAIKTGTTNLQELTPQHCTSKFSGMSYDSTYNVNFRLKVVVGYAIPKNLNISGDLRKKYDRAIADCFASYDLSPTIHEFAFEDDGRVLFTINYQAYIQDYFDKSYFDIFSSHDMGPMKAFEIKMRRAFDAATNDATTSGAPEVPEKDDPNAIKKLKYDALKSLLTRLFRKDRIYYFNVPYAEMDKANSGNSMMPVYDGDINLKNEDQVRQEIRNLENQAKNALDIFDEDRLKRKAQALQKELDQASSISRDKNTGFDSSTHRQVAFFFFYDLIDTIMEGIENSIEFKSKLLAKIPSPGAAEVVKQKELENLKKAKQNYARLRILLGPMEIRDPRNPKKHMYISMGEIPISVKYFSEWLSDKMLARDRVSYNLSTFIDEFIKNHISVFLNDKTCGGIKSTQPVAFHSTTLISYSAANDGKDDLSRLLVLQNKGIKNKNKKIDYWVPRGMTHVLNTQGARSEPRAPKNLGQARQKNWLVYYAARTRPNEQMRGNRAEDATKGISHYVVGQSTGIVKNIRLEKTPAPMLKEMRFEQEGYDGLLQLREVYNAVVDMFLLPNTFPGTIIFVDPRGFAPDTRGVESLNEDSLEKKMKPVDKYELTRYGVGGYYLVTKATHRIAEGERSTQLVSVWMHGHSRKGADPTPQPTEVDKNAEANKMQKCNITMDNTYTSEAAPELSDDVQRPFYDMGEQVIGGGS